MTKPHKVRKSDAEWRRELSPEQFYVTRQHGTERAFTGPYWDEERPGTYACVCCGTPLFSAETKFESGTGWPSFYEAKNREHVELVPDRSWGMDRVEVRCKSCGSHLGHLFEGEGYDTPTDQRFCINSISLRRVPKP